MCDISDFFHDMLHRSCSLQCWTDDSTRWLHPNPVIFPWYSHHNHQSCHMPYPRPSKFSYFPCYSHHIPESSPHAKTTFGRHGATENHGATGHDRREVDRAGARNHGYLAAWSKWSSSEIGIVHNMIPQVHRKKGMIYIYIPIMVYD